MTKGKEFLPLSPRAERSNSATIIQLIPRHLWGKGAFCLSQKKPKPLQEPGEEQHLLGMHWMDLHEENIIHVLLHCKQMQSPPLSLSCQTHAKDPLKEAIPAPKLPQT